MLVRSCLKSCMLGFTITWTRNFQMFKRGLEKEEEAENKMPTFTGSQRKLDSSKRMSTSVSSTMLKPLTVWSITHREKLLKRWEYQTILTASWETCTWVKKQQLEPFMEQLIGSGLRREHDRAVCCHSVCLTYLLSTSWGMPGWTSSKLDRWEKYQQTNICVWYHSKGRKQRGTEAPLDEGEGGEWESQLKIKY